MEDRIKRAVELFKKGFNCSQSVCAAFADMYGYTEDQALQMSASFGGGIGLDAYGLVARLAECFCWPACIKGVRMGQTGRARRPIMSWCNNWQMNLSAGTVL